MLRVTNWISIKVLNVQYVDLCSPQVVVYTGKRKLKDLVRFMDKEMEKAKKHRVKVMLANALV